MVDPLQRRALARRIADDYGGVLRRVDLLRSGMSTAEIRSEVRAGRWHRLGRHTISPSGPTTTGTARRWLAVWESGPGAVLDGASALIAEGMTGFTVDHIDVTVPHQNRAYPSPGVRIHRARDIRRSPRSGIPRTTAAAASIRAAQWAVSDRQAALVLCLPVQQRTLRPSELATLWRTTRRSPRRAVIQILIADLVDGARSLGELDFAALCRGHGLPTPDRQSVRTLPNRRAYLDAWFDSQGVVVEIDGGHHLLGLDPTDDALRANELAIVGERVLRIPLLGLRLEPAAFLDQIARALDR